MSEDRSIQVRIFQKKNEDASITELIKILNCESEPNFQLPKFVNWPRSKKSLTERATILMKAGVTYLEENFPKKEQFSDSEIKINSNKKEVEKEGWF
jgi:hypothetical protein